MISLEEPGGKWNLSRFDRVTNNLERMVRTARSDFILVSSDQKEFPVHRAILEVSCEFFGRMFQHNTVEVLSGKCRMEDVDGDALEALLEYLYYGHVSFTGQIADKMIVVADKYQLLHLKSLAEKCAGEDVSLDNVAELLLIGEQHSCSPQLKKRCHDFVIRNQKKFKSSESFEWLSSINLPLVNEVRTECFQTVIFDLALSGFDQSAFSAQLKEKRSSRKTHVILSGSGCGLGFVRLFVRHSSLVQSYFPRLSYITFENGGVSFDHSKIFGLKSIYPALERVVIRNGETRGLSAVEIPPGLCGIQVKITDSLHCPVRSDPDEEREFWLTLEELCPFISPNLRGCLKLELTGLLRRGQLPQLPQERIERILAIREPQYGQCSLEEKLADVMNWKKLTVLDVAAHAIETEVKRYARLASLSEWHFVGQHVMLLFR